MTKVAIACRRHVGDGRPFDGRRRSGERLFHSIALGYASPMTATPSSRCDIAIVGGGLAGGLAALAFAAKRPDLDVRLIEAGAVGGNHIWSFFDSDIAKRDRWLVAPLVRHQGPDRKRAVWGKRVSVRLDL